MRHHLIPIALVTVVTSGGLSLAAAAGAAPGAEPCAEAPPTTLAPDDTGPTDTADAPLDGRCAIDAEAYYLGYQGADVDSAMPALPAPTSGGVAPTPGDALGAEVLPLYPDEPGLLDDNTFVGAGDSRWVVTGDDRESTFALDVDTGSYTVAEAFLAEGFRPEPDSVRPEEWINAYDYGDSPAVTDDLALTIDSGQVATAPGATLVRIGVSSREIASAERPAANITFVVDTSGSMDIRERLGLVKASLALLVKNLRPDDTIAIVTYGDVATPVLAPTPVAEWPAIVGALEALRPSGSTNMEAGLHLGYEVARRTFDPARLNVVVLASDGVANQGVTDAEELTSTITQAGDEGIHLVTVGYGMGNYNDHLMEQLADRGDGFYAYVDTFAEAVRLFVTDLTPTLTVVAEQAKVQVVFDPDVVARYRLIGYANRSLDDAQFSDDTIDGGEIGAGHHVSALYEIELVDGPGPAPSPGSVRLRWADPATGEVTEVAEPIELGHSGGEPAPASGSLRLAAAVAYTAEVLQGAAVASARGVTLEALAAEATELVAAGVPGAAELAALLTLAVHAGAPSAAGESPAGG